MCQGFRRDEFQFRGVVFALASGPWGVIGLNQHPRLYLTELMSQQKMLG